MSPPASSALPLNVAPSATPSRSSTSPIASGSGPSAPLKSTASTSDISSPHELTAFVETLLEQLDAKFDDMSSQILERMMQMFTRVDALEASIQDIINGENTAAAAPTSGPQSPSPQRKTGA